MGAGALIDEHVETIELRLKSKIYSQSEIRAAVRCELQYILPAWLAKPYPFGLQPANRRDAADIKDLVKKLVQKLERTPAVLILAARMEPEKWSLRDANSPAVKALKHRLANLQRGCDEVLDQNNVVGDHPNRDRVKEICAGCAIDLIVGLEAGRPTNSPVRDIASDLFMAISPDPPAKTPDLRRHSEAEIARWPKMSEAAQKAHIDQVWTRWEFTQMITRKSASSV
jgi:hypothetical protein